MNGAEALDEAFDEAFDESVDEAFDEARFRPRRVATARPRPMPARSTGSPVTQAQLQAAVTRLNGDIARNSTAIQKVNTSLTTLGRDVRRQTAASRSTKKDIVQLRDAVMLLPMLSGKLSEANPMLGVLLPMMLLGGIGESGGSGSSGGGMLGGDQSTSMLMVLALSGALNKQN